MSSVVKLPDTSHLGRLEDLLFDIRIESEWCEFVRSFYLENKERFDAWPASCGRAKHHGEEGGLFEHSLETAKTALAIASQYEFKKIGDRFTCIINTPLTVAAAFLHDSGKIYEYQRASSDVSVNPEGFLFERSDVGRLEHHIPIGYRLVARHLEKFQFPEKDKSNFLHCILAHHGRMEWHSPVEPKTPEAHIVHVADTCSAYIDSYAKRGKLHGAD